MKGILFLCPHGGAKSVVAASLFNRLAAERGLPFVATAAAAEDPYDAVPTPVADYLQREGFDVREIVAIGCNLAGAEGRGVISARWDDVPPASEDLEGSVAAIRRHVEALAEDLDGHR